MRTISPLWPAGQTRRGLAFHVGETRFERLLPLLQAASKDKSGIRSLRRYAWPPRDPVRPGRVGARLTGILHKVPGMNGAAFTFSFERNFLAAPSTNSPALKTAASAFAARPGGGIDSRTLVTAVLSV